MRLVASLTIVCWALIGCVTRVIKLTTLARIVLMIGSASRLGEIAMNVWPPAGSIWLVGTVSPENEHRPRRRCRKTTPFCCCFFVSSLSTLNHAAAVAAFVLYRPHPQSLIRTYLSLQQSFPAIDQEIHRKVTLLVVDPHSLSRAPRNNRKIHTLSQTKEVAKERAQSLRLKSDLGELYDSAV